MLYSDLIRAVFIERKNRFSASVLLNGEIEVVHVKNTGRLRELLIPGAAVLVQRAENPERKTKYDLIMVWSESYHWVNIDSIAPNVLVHQWLTEVHANRIKPEYKYGDSRLDFYAEINGRKILTEVKGCTLAENGCGIFPDAPTERGSKHLQELIRAKAEGYDTFLIFVIMLEGINKVAANIKTDPMFASMLNRAVESGVNILYLSCRSDEKGTYIVKNDVPERIR